MKLHVLKIKKEYWWDVDDGTKNFELRFNDRNYEAGDLIHFVDVNGEDYSLKGNEKSNVFQITYILKAEDAPTMGLKEGWCILGIKRLIRKEC